MRLLRRTATLEVVEADLSLARTWAEHGLIEATDLCAIPGVGTLAASEVPELEQARKRGQANALKWAIAGLGAVLLALALATGDEAQAMGSLLLLAVAQTALLTASESPRRPLDELPREASELRSLLRRGYARSFASSLQKAAGVCAFAALAAMPGTATSLGTAIAGLSFLAGARLLRRI